MRSCLTFFLFLFFPHWSCPLKRTNACELWLTALENPSNWKTTPKSTNEHRKKKSMDSNFSLYVKHLLPKTFPFYWLSHNKILPWVASYTKNGTHGSRTSMWFSKRSDGERRDPYCSEKQEIVLNILLRFLLTVSGNKSWKRSHSESQQLRKVGSNVEFMVEVRLQLTISGDLALKENWKLLHCHNLRKHH